MDFNSRSFIPQQQMADSPKSANPEASNDVSADKNNPQDSSNSDKVTDSRSQPPPQNQSLKNVPPPISVSQGLEFQPPVNFVTANQHQPQVIQSMQILIAPQIFQGPQPNFPQHQQQLPPQSQMQQNMNTGQMWAPPPNMQLQNSYDQINPMQQTNYISQQGFIQAQRSMDKTQFQQQPMPQPQMQQRINQMNVFTPQPAQTTNEQLEFSQSDVFPQNSGPFLQLPQQAQPQQQLRASQSVQYQKQDQKICQEYSYGFCMYGPNCHYKHIRYGAEDRKNYLFPGCVPPWYLRKVSKYFNSLCQGPNQQLVTNYASLMDLLQKISLSAEGGLSMQQDITKSLSEALSKTHSRQWDSQLNVNYQGSSQTMHAPSYQPAPFVGQSQDDQSSLQSPIKRTESEVYSAHLGGSPAPFDFNKVRQQQVEKSKHADMEGLFDTQNVEFITPPMSEDNCSSLTGGGSSRGGHENKEAWQESSSRQQTQKQYQEMVWRQKKTFKQTVQSTAEQEYPPKQGTQQSRPRTFQNKAVSSYQKPYRQQNVPRYSQSDKASSGTQRRTRDTQMMDPSKQYYVSPERVLQLQKDIENCDEYVSPARYFVMKSIEPSNLEVSYKEGIWSTTFGPTQKLKEAFQSTKNVMLIFSITESGCFQGFARMKNLPSSNLKPHIFKYTPNSDIHYNDNFEVEWICTNVNYHYRNLNGFPPNPLNQNYTIMQSKNGQEIPFRHGNYIVTEMLKCKEGVTMAKNQQRYQREQL